MLKLKNIFANVKPYGITFAKWLALGILTGGVGGLFGALFSKAIAYVTELRGAHGWLLYLLPIGGVITALLYRGLRIKGIGTNQVFEGVTSDRKVSFWLAPAVFICSIITHLCGGSAGREGAALQLGGGVSALLGKAFGLEEDSRRIITICGMAAFFSAIFGTPVGACVFAIEVVRVGAIRLNAVFPTMVSGVTAFYVAQLLNAEAERFPLNEVPKLGLNSLWKVLLIAMLGALVAIFFCAALHFTEKCFKKYLKLDYIMALVGGVAIILLTWLVGSTDYNGGGIDIIHNIFTHGQVRYEAFLLKILFTALTVAGGYKGGEIVPTFFIGATFGGSMALLLGLDPGFGAAIGMAALFCGVTNCPLATVFLCVEMFGSESMIFIAISAFTAFLLSGKASLYHAQIFASEKNQVKEKILETV